MSHCINPKCPNPQNRDTQMFCQSCGSELLLEARYRVMRLLGQGGCGKTFEVSDRDGTPKVLKILINNHPKYVELFQREALVISRLNHPGIPLVESDAYFTFSPKNSTEPLHCLVMEKIEGMDLSEYQQQRQNRPISQKVAIEWLTQLAAVLQEVHSQKFFHRDIKPSNIMPRAEGNLVLIDFGTVRAVTGTYVTKQAAGQVTGVVSAGYTPPEQINGQAVPQSDFFALGRTFVYLLTGKDTREFYDAATDELRWRNSAAGISPRLADFIDSLMVRLPSQRPQTAKEILQKLAEINRALYPPKQPVPGSPSPNSAPANAPALLPLRRRLPAIPPPVLWLIAVLLVLPAMAYLFIPVLRYSTTTTGPRPAPPAPAAGSSPELSLPFGSLILVTNYTAENAQGKSEPVVLFGKPEQPEVVGTVQAGSILQVIRKDETHNWVRLKVCWTPAGDSSPPAAGPDESDSVPPKKNRSDKPAPAPGGKPAPPTPPPVRPGDIGWLLEEKVHPVAVEIPDPTMMPPGECPDAAQGGGRPAESPL